MRSPMPDVCHDVIDRVLNIARDAHPSPAGAVRERAIRYPSLMAVAVIGVVTACSSVVSPGGNSSESDCEALSKRMAACSISSSDAKGTCLGHAQRHVSTSDCEKTFSDAVACVNAQACDILTAAVKEGLGDPLSNGLGDVMPACKAKLSAVNACK